MSQNLNSAVAVIGIDIGKNSFHIVGLDYRGAIVLRQKWSRGQIEARLGNMPPCLIGMEACVGAPLTASSNSSCYARPDHTYGSRSVVARCLRHFRLALDSGLVADIA